METDTLRVDHGPVARALDLAGTQKRPIHSASGTRTEEVWLAPGISQAMATGSQLPCIFFCLDRFSFGLAPPPAWPTRPLVLFQRVLFQIRPAVAPRLYSGAGAAVVPPRTGSTLGVAEDEPTY